MRKTLLAVTAAALVVATLGGCGSLSIYNRHEEYFDTYAEAQDGWVGGSIPAWIPTDSTAVRSITTTDGDKRIVRVKTKSEPVGSCTTEPSPDTTPLPSGWTPQVFPSEVTVCGDYSIIAADGGWFGWLASAEATPAAGTAK